MVKCTFKKLGKYKMNKEVETSLLETKAREGLRQRWFLLFGMFWMEHLMLCGSMPMLGVTPLSYVSLRGLSSPPIRRHLCQGADHKHRFWKPRRVSFLPSSLHSFLCPPLSFALRSLLSFVKLGISPGTRSC